MSRGRRSQATKNVENLSYLFKSQYLCWKNLTFQWFSFHWIDECSFITQLHCLFSFWWNYCRDCSVLLDFLLRMETQRRQIKSICFLLTLQKKKVHSYEFISESKERGFHGSTKMLRGTILGLRIVQIKCFFASENKRTRRTFFIRA